MATDANGKNIKSEKEKVNMASCEECGNFFALGDDPRRGDCVQRVVDARQTYFKSKPVEAKDDAGACPEFRKGESRQ